MSVYPVIMCGGSGTRLWPASRGGSPKQFIRLVGDLSTFQQTVARVAGLQDAGMTVVIAGEAHEAAIHAQLKAMSMPAQLLLEPQGRDSAPAMAAAAAWVLGQDPEGVMVVVAADHHVPDAQAFRTALDQAVKAAKDGFIVTLGVRPTSPSTAYGYIRPAAALGPVRQVVAFVEKPDAATAEAYVEDGYLWNSGNFVVQAKTLLGELDAAAPAVSAAARAAVTSGMSRGGNALLLGEAFLAAPKISIDYAVMEKTTRAAVLPVSFEWSDLGAWNAVMAASTRDAAGNAVEGQAVLIDVAGSYVRAAKGMIVAAIGARDLAIIAEPDGVLVCDLAASQDVKAVVEQLKASADRQIDRASIEAAAEDIDLPAYAARYDHWLSTAALPVWWTLGADHARGGFHESLRLDGAATAAPRRARCQARQVFVYATAGALGWPGPWLEAANHGLAYFTKHYRLPDGRFRALVAPDGSPLDNAAVLYDQAFALLAMAAVYRMQPARADLKQDAEALLAAIKAACSHPGGGFRETGDHPFYANPHMHLLEAALAWGESGGGTAWDELAETIVALALKHFIDASGGFLREYFDAAWRPAEGPDGRSVEPGHQFEWAWLLDRWAQRSGNAAAREAAVRLFAIGTRGLDPARDVVIDELDERLAIVRPTARLWPQTERLKAAVRLGAAVSGKAQEDYLGHALSACRGLWRYLEVPTPGLWRDLQAVDGVFEEAPAPASSLYHLVGAVAVLKPLLTGTQGG